MEISNNVIGIIVFCMLFIQVLMFISLERRLRSASKKVKTHTVLHTENDKEQAKEIKNS